MATITVGTNSYISEADAATYWADRGNSDWADAEADAKRTALIKATDYIDRNFKFRGVKATSSQRLAWPRNEAYDDDGFLIGDSLANLPTVLVEATAMLADLYRSGTFNFERTVTASDTSIKKQKVDVIEIEYETSDVLKGSDVPVYVHDMLTSITVGGGGTSLLRY